MANQFLILIPTTGQIACPYFYYSTTCIHAKYKILRKSVHFSTAIYIALQGNTQYDALFYSYA